MSRVVAIVCLAYLALCVIVYFRQRSMMYFPSHAVRSSALVPWLVGDRTIGYAREAPHARVVWLMMHGNAGQAADRDYVLPRLSDEDSLYVLEYPGYGQRDGSPSRESINQAASEAYHGLRSRHPTTPICVLAESIGSGPACALARENPPPDKIVLVVPFDTLVNVAARHFPFLPVRLMLRDRWDNVEALSNYPGPVDVFGAREDTIIPIEHAKALARRVSQSRFTEIPGGHNEWSEADEVIIRH